jgi:micrococcal nuclease
MKVLDTDRYGRSIANVLIDGKSRLCVGCLYAVLQNSELPERYQYEAVAKNKKIGLWAHLNPIPHWDFRRSKTSTSARDNKTISPRTYRGNTRSMLFHQENCEYFNCKNCTEVFQRREDAVAAGYKPCGRCRP